MLVKYNYLTDHLTTLKSHLTMRETNILYFYGSFTHTGSLKPSCLHYCSPRSCSMLLNQVIRHALSVPLCSQKLACVLTLRIWKNI